MQTERGQTLIELIVVIAMTVLVTGALTFATIASLRNSDLAKSQTQATKLAQEGLEKVRIIRDQDGPISYDDGSTDQNHLHTKFSDLWGMDFICPPGVNCYFKFISSGTLQGVSATDYESIDLFKRQIMITGAKDMPSKQVTSIVSWVDSSGSHESRLTTILGQRL